MTQVQVRNSITFRTPNGDVEIGSRLLRTTSVSAINAPPVLSYGVTSLPKRSTIARTKTIDFAQKDGEEAYPAKSAPPDAAFSREDKTVSRLPKPKSTTQKALKVGQLFMAPMFIVILALRAGAGVS